MLNFFYVLIGVYIVLRMIFIKAYRWFMWDEEQWKVHNNALKKLRREEKEVRNKARQEAKDKVLADLCA